MLVVKNPDGVMMLSAGKRWKRGQRIGAGELPPALRDALLKEDAIVEVKGEEAAAIRQAEATDKAVALAVELGVDLADVDGSGARGRILVRDVLKFAVSPVSNHRAGGEQ